MGFAEFLEKRFLGQKICISMDNGESETIVLDQFWSQNREYFEGTLKEVVEGVIVLHIEGNGEMYINPDNISYAWQPPLNPLKVMRTSLNRKPYAVGKKL